MILLQPVILAFLMLIKYRQPLPKGLIKLGLLVYLNCFLYIFY